jgi:ISXO2-like transposase domain
MIGSEWPVEIDECFFGGATRGEGEGVHHKTVVVGAVEARTRTEGGRSNARAHTRRRLYAGRLRLAVVDDRSAKSLVPFVTANVVKGAKVKTDAHDGYRDLCELHGYSHDIMVMAGDPKNAEKHLPPIHRIFSNLKAWLDGTHHGRVEPQHLQAYLNEFVFRFNRRFYPMTAFNSVLGISARTVSPTYAELYSGKWKHPS